MRFPAQLTCLALLALPASVSPRYSHATVISAQAHDAEAFTQGLDWHEGTLYESSGGLGQSWIRATTGSAKARVSLPDEWFAEGLAVTPAGVWLITWRNRIASLRDPVSLAEIRQVHYAGEGWGLCYNGRNLLMSNGSATLTRRDADTFAALGEVEVTLDGLPVGGLNELECRDGTVWANVYGRNVIYGIDPMSGAVTDVLEIGALPGLPDAPESRPGMPNGITSLPGSSDLLITGKLWPAMYRIRSRGARRSRR